MDLQFAAVAGAGVDLANGEASAEPAARGAVEMLSQFGQRVFVEQAPLPSAVDRSRRGRAFCAWFRDRARSTSS